MLEEYRETAPARHTRPRDTKLRVFTVLMRPNSAFSKNHANFNNSGRNEEPLENRFMLSAKTLGAGFCPLFP